jgi:hypothetical protein
MSMCKALIPFLRLLHSEWAATAIDERG